MDKRTDLKCLVVNEFKLILVSKVLKIFIYFVLKPFVPPCLIGLMLVTNT